MRLAALEAGHRGLLVGGLHPPVAHLGDVFGQGKVARDGFVTLEEVLVVHLLRLLDHGVDHVDLTSLRDLAPHESEELQPGGVRIVVGAYGLASGRQFVDDRDVQVAVEGHGKRAGDGGGGHHQHVGRPGVLRPEAGPLLHAEAVLLVDHHEAQVAELHLVLDQGVGADQQLYFARGDPLQRRPALLRLRRAGQDGHPDRQSVEHAGDGGEVLAGQNLRGCHHAGLEAVVDGQQHRHQRHHRLAAAHVALQQPVHLAARHGVAPDLADHPFLGAREGEGDLLVVEIREDGAHLRKEESVVSGYPFRPARLDAQLHAQQLVELQAVLRLP